MVGAQRSDMTEQAKPKGVIVLAALYLVSVGVYIVLLTLWIVAPETLSSILGALTPGGVTGPERLLVLGAYLPVYFSVMGVITAALAYGMWTLRNWARIVTILITAVSLIGTLPGLAALFSDFMVGALLLNVLRVGLSVLVLWYLWTPAVRDSFARSSEDK